MMTEAQFPAELPIVCGGCYNRYVHVLVIFAISIPAMCYIGHIDDFLMGMIHNLGHIFSKHLRLVLARRDLCTGFKKMRCWPPSTVHTLNHHKFLTYNKMRFKGIATNVLRSFRHLRWSSLF